MADETTPAAPATEKPAAPEERKPSQVGIVREADPTLTAAGAIATGDEKPKRKKTPGKSPHIGKKLRNARKANDQKVRALAVQPVKLAITTLRSFKKAKFDETVEVHINLGIDSTQSDQMVRGSVGLPHGIGKAVRVAVFCQGDNVARAKAAGADVVGGTDLVERVQKEGFLDFDVAIASQDMMGLVSRLGKVLGPRGLMPTPKAGTVVAGGDIGAAVGEFKAGKVEYRSDKSGQIHVGVGKLSFDDQKLIENITTIVETVRAAKPSGVKGNYINGIVLSATMMPGVRMSV
jgi:large subunit ribosomal protein L1